MHEIMEQSKIAPEEIKVLNVYLTNLDLNSTAAELGIPTHQVATILKKKEVAHVINTALLENGWFNRFKIRDLLGEIINQKLDEAQESGVYTNKDLFDIITQMHKMSIEERKLDTAKEAANTPRTQVNTQVNNYGENFGKLMERIINGNQ